MKKAMNYLTLFTSVSTLLCCAIPALLVALGLGASLAGAVSSFPQLAWISEYKIYVFATGAIFLLIGGLQMYSTPLECPIDKKDACEDVKKSSKFIYWISVIIYLIGLSFAYILPNL